MVANVALVGLLGWPTCHSRPKLTNISQFPIETKVYFNDFSSDIFKSLNVDNQMSLSCGQDEPLGCPENAFFSCAIGIYLVSFFFDHPVVIFIFQSYFFPVKRIKTKDFYIAGALQNPQMAGK